MSGRFFADSNILLYLLSADAAKLAVAKQILYSGAVISTQVISENINILLRKMGKPVDFASQHKYHLEQFCEVIVVNSVILSLALGIKEKYAYQWHDSIIIAAALHSNCELLYSEDMQRGQVIEGRLTIINPFLPA